VKPTEKNTESQICHTTLPVTVIHTPRRQYGWDHGRKGGAYAQRTAVSRTPGDYADRQTSIITVFKNRKKLITVFKIEKYYKYINK